MFFNQPTNKQKKVVHVYGNFPKKKGSMEEYYLALTRKLNQIGFKSIFIFTDDIDDALKKFYDEVGAEIIVMPGTNKRFDLPLIFKYQRLFRKIAPVLVNVNFGRTSFNALVAARFARINNTVWTKGSFYEKGPFYQPVPKIRIFTSLIFLAGWLSKKIMVISEGLRKELLLYDLPASKIVRIYRGINLERFKSQKISSSFLHEFRINKEDRVVACISQARHEKGLEYLLRAMPSVIGKFSRLKLLIVGGGPLTNSLKKLAEELNVADHVVFCGVRNDVEKIINISEFTVLPSLTEGLGLVTLESLACGKPVVASNVGGIPEVVVDGETGFLVPPRDEHALADKINYLLSDSNLLKKMKDKCLARAQQFDVNVGAAKTVELYLGLIRENV